MTLTITNTERERRRTLVTGAIVVHTRFVLNFREPRRGRRRQVFAKSHKEAIAKRDALIAAAATTNTYSEDRPNFTVAKAIEHWLESRQGSVKTSTLRTYRQVSKGCIIGPLTA